MSTSSMIASRLASVVDRFARWTDAEDDGDALVTFLRIFAGIWLLYDVVDLAWGMTERSMSWFPHPRSAGLVALQAVLIASEAALVMKPGRRESGARPQARPAADEGAVHPDGLRVWLAGNRIWLAGTTAAVARALEAGLYFPLNDFYFVAVVALLVAHSVPRRAAARPPKWVRDALLVQLAWVYLATAALKMNPDWLGGGHLFVRTQYLAFALHWPYPAFVARALASLAFDAVLAKLGIALELALAAVLLARRPYRLGVALALAIHVVGALLTNVWFFSATMIAAVATLLPRSERRGRPDE